MFLTRIIWANNLETRWELNLMEPDNYIWDTARRRVGKFYQYLYPALPEWLRVGCYVHQNAPAGGTTFLKFVNFSKRSCLPDTQCHQSFSREVTWGWQVRLRGFHRVSPVWNIQHEICGVTHSKCIQAPHIGMRQPGIPGSQPSRAWFTQVIVFKG